MSNEVNTYTAFSGADMVAYVGTIRLGNLYAISYSIMREKGPQYGNGSSDPLTFNRGKRIIAGSLVFSEFDTGGLSELMENSLYQFACRNGSTAFRDSGSQGTGATLDAGYEWKQPLYPDQLPPFNITLTFINDHGKMATRSIFDVEISSSGGGVSMDDLRLEEQMSFAALKITPLRTITV